MLLFFQAANQDAPLIAVSIGNSTIAITLVDAFSNFSGDTELAWERYV